MDKARGIIKSLMGDKDLYKKASQREGEVWGKTLSSPERDLRQRKDQVAAKVLGLNQGQNLSSLLIKRGMKHFNSGLSLACGTGRAERQFIKQNLVAKFHGIDVAEEALLKAAELAKSEGLDITYEKGDLNKIVLDENAYDLVVTQNCLHHVLQLEHLADQILKSMCPGGVLWIHDFIGESQFQYSDQRLRWVNALLSALPEKFRSDTLNNRIISNVLKRPEPGRLVSPFEAIRSSDIVPVFLERFDVIEKCEWDTVEKYVCPTGCRSAYVENEDTKVIFDLIAAVDKMLLEEGVLKPCAGQYLLTPKR